MKKNIFTTFPVTVWNLSHCCLSHRVNADLEIFLGLFQLCASLLATKTTSLEKINCLKAIPSLLSELILLFSPKDLLRNPRRESNVNQFGFGWSPPPLVILFYSVHIIFPLACVFMFIDCFLFLFLFFLQ